MRIDNCRYFWWGWELINLIVNKMYIVICIYSYNSIYKLCEFIYTSLNVSHKWNAIDTPLGHPTYEERIGLAHRNTYRQFRLISVELQRARSDKQQTGYKYMCIFGVTNMCVCVCIYIILKTRWKIKKYYQFCVNGWCYMSAQWERGSARTSDSWGCSLWCCARPVDSLSTTIVIFPISSTPSTW